MLIWNQHPTSHIVSQLQSTCVYPTLWDLTQLFLGKLVQCKALSIKDAGKPLQGHSKKMGPRDIPPCSFSTAANSCQRSSDTHFPSCGAIPAGRRPVSISATRPWFLWTSSGLPSCSGRFLSPIGGCSPNQLEPLPSGIVLHHQQIAFSRSPVRSDSHPGIGLGSQGGTLFHLFLLCKGILPQSYR